MPPLPIIVNVDRCAFLWESASTGQHAVNVMHFDQGETGSPGALFGALETAVSAQMWFSLSSDWRITTVSITPLDGLSATTDFSPPDSAAWKGDDAGDWIPQAASIVKLQTGRRGRTQRGRVFLGPVAEAAVTNGRIVTGILADWQSGWTGFMTTMDSAGFPLVVASYKLAEASNVNNVACEPVLGTQRRRQTRLR